LGGREDQEDLSLILEDFTKKKVLVGLFDGFGG
jgi:hypothetical protein